MTQQQEAAPVPFPHPSGPLAGYRVLDLADEKGQLCARLLGELGADVIKVEGRDGDPTRGNGPFFRGEQGPNTSLYWWAMNAGKRSITCELRLEQGRQLFHQLVAKSDIVIETLTPGASKDLGLDYRTLSAVNPGIILVSITNFGQTGPYRNFLATDIVGLAMGGQMYLNGDDEHGPVRPLAPQAYAQVNIQAAAGAAIALFARGTNGGAGQHVDVSMQEAVANTMDSAQPTWDILGVNNRGPGLRRMRGGELGPRYLFEAEDGWIAGLHAAGLVSQKADAIIDWMAETGEAGDLATDSWRRRLTSGETLTFEEMVYVEETLNAFCKRRKKEALIVEAQRRGAGWSPVYGPREVVEAEQLRARDYWVRVRHDDIGESFIYPGPPFVMGETPWMQRGRAPSVGEHNNEVYGEVLGLEAADVRRLRMRMVI